MANNIFKELEKGSLPGLKRCISLFPSSVNAKNSTGATPLHVAASQGQSSFVKDLLVHGAAHDVTDGQGNLPLHLAAEQGSLETVTELLTGPGRKLVVKAKNREGQTPLHQAVRKGHTAVVAKLLDAGARTDVKDKSGVTPLELVSAENEEMLQLLLDGTPTNSLGNMSQGIGTAAAPTPARTLELSHSSHRLQVSGSLTPTGASGLASGRFATPPPVSVTAGSRVATATPLTPPSRGAAHGGGGPATARASHSPGLGGTPGATTNRGTASVTPGGLSSRLPRNASGLSSSSAAAAAAAGGAAKGDAAGGPSSVNAQFQKQDAAIQALKAGLRAATERLGAVDACASAQIECAAQVEKALELCGSQGRSLADLEARVGFQEERTRDSRSRLERLEEGERALQASVARLTDDSRGLTAELQKLADQVTAGGAAPMQQQQAAAVSQVQMQLQTELVTLKAQMEHLAPALGVAAAANAEARALSARLDAVQQQQQQQALTQAQQQLHPTVGGNVLMDQQVLQLQAQVQLLQLPVASLTQQCADLSARLGAVTEWQQQARADLAKLAEAAAQANANHEGANRVGGELSDAVMRVLDTTARTMAELRQQQDETAKQVVALQQQLQQQQAPGTAPGTPQPAAQAGIPATPQSARVGSTGGDATPLGGGGQSRNLSGLPSLNSMARDAAAQAELRSELEALKSLVADVRKEVASEGGSLRREWQRAFSDMQSRYGEQTNELRAREQNIAKLREAAMMDEAERRAAAGFEEKVGKRLSKLETGIEYLTHRLEVLEEQVSGLANTVTGSTSPQVALSPAGLPPAGHLPFGKQDSRSTPRSGPGPVSENHSVLTAHQLPVPHLTAAAASLVAASCGPLPDGGCRPLRGQTRSPLGSGGRYSEVQSACPSMLDGSSVLQASPLASMGGCAPEGRPGQGPDRSGRVTESLAREEDEWWRAATPHSARPPGATPRPGSARTPMETGRSRLSQPGEDVAFAFGIEGRSGGRGVGDGTACGTTGCSSGLDKYPAAAEARTDLATARSDLQSLAAITPQGTSSPMQLAGSVVTAGTEAMGSVPVSVQFQYHYSGLVGVPNQAALDAGITGMPAVHMPQQAVASLPRSCTPPGPSPRGALPPPSAAAQHPQYSLLHTAAVLPDGGLQPIDPANVVLGPQLLPAAAQALLAPSVDIQRLAAAAAAQQQHQSQQGQVLLSQQQSMQLQMAAQVLNQRHQQQMQLGTVGSTAPVAGSDSAGAVPGVGPVAASGRHAGMQAAAGSSGRSASRGSPVKEPPTCLPCSVQ